jgi:hypothetical protein
MSHDILRALCLAGASFFAVLGLAFVRKEVWLKLWAGRPSAPTVESPGSMVRFATGRQLLARRAFARRPELASADNVATLARRALVGRHEAAGLALCCPCPGPIGRQQEANDA